MARHNAKSYFCKMRFPLILIFVFTAVFSNAQPVFFETIFGTNDHPEFAYAVKQLPDSSIYAAGYMAGGLNGSTDAALFKFNRAGQLLWTKYYGDSLGDNALYLNTTNDGNLILVGETSVTSSNQDIHLWKVDTAGNLLWEKFYGGPLNESAKYVEQTSDSGFILSGFQNASFANDAYVLKVDSVGNYQWDLTTGGSDNDYADQVHQLPDHGYVFTYDTRRSGNYDVGVTRLNSAGSIVWDKAFGDSLQNGCQGVTLLSNGNLMSFGETEIFPTSPYDFFEHEIDMQGDSVWRRTFGGNMTDALFSLKDIGNGELIGCGYSNSYVSGPISFVVVKTDTAGNMIWVHTFGGTGIDIGYEIIPAIDGGWLAVGITSEGADGQGYLLHLDPSGWASVAALTSSAQTVNVSPNPGDGMFHVEYPTTVKQCMTRVTDLQGREIFSGMLSGSELDLRNAANGMYVLDLVSESWRGRALLIKSTY